MRRSSMACWIWIALTSAALAEEVTVRGPLRRTVEAGGWVIVGPKKYLVLNARAFAKNAWFRAGQNVEAVGEVMHDVVSIHQEGIPLRVRSVRPLAGAVPAANNEATTDEEVQPPPAIQDPPADPPARPASGPKPTRLTVSGQAVVHAQPDTAIVTVAVVTQSGAALEAQQENARRSAAVVRAVRGAAGPTADVKTTGYRLQPQYDTRNGQAPVIRGYEARNSVVVTLADLEKVGSVIDAASQAGANNIDGLAFTRREDRAAREEALAAATRDAMQKARAIAASLQGTLRRVVQVREGGAAPVPRWEMARGMMAAAEPTPIEPGVLDVSAQVELVVEIDAHP